MDKPFVSPEAADFEIDPVSSDRCYELTSARAGTAFRDEWPALPGAVRRTPSGRALILHCAPDRWLIPDPDDDVLAECEEYVAAGVAYLVDVDGKWRMITLSADTAREVLARDCFAESVLDGRGCAPMTLFDCAVVIVSGSVTFDIWVQSSYLPAFLRVLRSGQFAGN